MMSEMSNETYLLELPRVVTPWRLARRLVGVGHSALRRHIFFRCGGTLEVILIDVVFPNQVPINHTKQPALAIPNNPFPAITVSSDYRAVSATQDAKLELRHPAAGRIIPPK